MMHRKKKHFSIQFSVERDAWFRRFFVSFLEFLNCVWILCFIVLFNDVWCVAWTWEVMLKKKYNTFITNYRYIASTRFFWSLWIDQYNRSLCNSQHNKQLHSQYTTLAREKNWIDWIKRRINENKTQKRARRRSDHFNTKQFLYTQQRCHGCKD